MKAALFSALCLFSLAGANARAWDQYPICAPGETTERFDYDSSGAPVYPHYYICEGGAYVEVSYDTYNAYRYRFGRN